MKFQKSNSGLGHKEYVYLMHCIDDKYIVLNDIDFYKKGEIDIFRKWELEPLNEEDKLFLSQEYNIQLS